jgi:predicted PurR-regulated permease PerM
MIVMASWQPMIFVQYRLGGSRILAVIVMTLILTLVMMVPLTIAFTAIVNNIDVASNYIRDIASHGLPPAPSWLEQFPVIGSRLVNRYHQLAGVSREELLGKISPYLGASVQWLLQQIGSVGHLVLHFVLTLVLSAVMYSRGEVCARGILSFGRRLADDRGEHALILASQAIRAVASGVVLTALIQAVMATVGLVLAGVPYSVMLGSLVFLLSVIQIGAGPVLFGATAWLFYSDYTVTAWVFLAWSAVILICDNFIRPFLIKRGANLPLLLIFAGVIGGLLTFGIIGIFIGPVVLAVTYTFLQAWTYRGEIVETPDPSKN